MSKKSVKKCNQNDKNTKYFIDYIIVKKQINFI